LPSRKVAFNSPPHLDPVGVPIARYAIRKSRLQCQTKIPNDHKGVCDACKAERNKSVDDTIRQHASGYDALLDTLRKSKRWQQIRASIMRRDVWCKRCGTNASEIVDHIVPAPIAIAQAEISGKYGFDKYAGYYLKSNLQGLCRKCHAIKTAQDKAHTGPWPNVMEKEAQQPKKVWSF
jgi:5-methylcytosine-specific restriction endonuclease McrA